MELNILANLKRNTYDLLENYVIENKTGLAYIYLIMSNETKDLLCGKDSNLFYGVKIATNNTLDFGEIKVTFTKRRGD